MLGQASLDKNGKPCPIGRLQAVRCDLTVTPDIHESIINVDISQELSSFSGEVLIFAGQNETKTDETESCFLGFNLGKQSSQGDTEIPVFVEAQRI